MPLVNVRVIEGVFAPITAADVKALRDQAPAAVPG